MTRSQFTNSSPYFRREVEEDVGGPVTTYRKEKQEEEKSTVPKKWSRALVIAGTGMRRKHSYDTGVGMLEDIEEVASVLETEPSVRDQAFLEEAEDYPEEGEDETLVEVDGELYKEKEVEIEVSDSDPDSDAESVSLPQDGCGLRRKRTIRVVIRSRAFI